MNDADPTTFEHDLASLTPRPPSPDRLLAAAYEAGRRDGRASWPGATLRYAAAAIVGLGIGVAARHTSSPPTDAGALAARPPHDAAAEAAGSVRSEPEPAAPAAASNTAVDLVATAPPTRDALPPDALALTARSIRLAIERDGLSALDRLPTRGGRAADLPIPTAATVRLEEPDA